MDKALKNYLIITAGYWAFTVTDGAIRMLVVLYFHLIGYSPLEVAMLFLFYEFFGIITNLVGGWLGSRIGLNMTMHIGMGLQVVALSLLMAPEPWLTVAFVMFAQALSGIAKDLNKMSAKASIKTLLPQDANSESKLFKWVAALTGSKNALKGAGFFIGAVLLQWFQFRGAMAILATALLLVLIVSIFLLPGGLGKTQHKAKFTEVFSKSAAINWLSAARFFLFGARDIWFVVALPVYLYSVLGWDFKQVGGLLAIWIIGYGVVQALAPRIIGSKQQQQPNGSTAQFWAFVLAIFPAAIALGLGFGNYPQLVLIIGLIAFGIVFAINSAVHSYLIVAMSEHDKVSMNVGFYYMANAGGRLVGTVLSGWVYQGFGLIACLWCSCGFVLISALLSSQLPRSAKTALR